MPSSGKKVAKKVAELTLNDDDMPPCDDAAAPEPRIFIARGFGAYHALHKAGERLLCVRTAPERRRGTSGADRATSASGTGPGTSTPTRACT